jgi:hypothetical protein
MQTNHENSHNKPCTCINSADKNKCYLWILNELKPDLVIIFNSISEACAYGGNQVMNEDSRYVCYGDNINDSHTIWTDANGKKRWAYVKWNNTVCTILNDVHSNNIPSCGYWTYLSTYNKHMNIGLGSDLPHTVQTYAHMGYYLSVYERLGRDSPLFCGPTD